MGWSNDFGWAGWLMMSVGMTGFWILVGVLVVVVVRSAIATRPESTDAREILERRLARGEIDVEEYQRRLDVLTEASG